MPEAGIGKEEDRTSQAAGRRSNGLSRFLRPAVCSFFRVSSARPRRGACAWPAILLPIDLRATAPDNQTKIAIVPAVVPTGAATGAQIA
jgi:hypothetical protein